MKLAGRILLAAWAVGCGGCTVTIPKPSYQKVDKEAPAFKEAVAVEKKLLEEQGKPAGKAEERAVRNVTKEIIQVESGRRSVQVSPLAEALGAFDRPRGCWAYTFTTTTRTKGKTTVDIATFDAFQPEERLFTLVSRDGKAPDEKAQENYRRSQLKAWKKSLEGGTSRKGKKRTPASQMWTTSSTSDLEVTEPDSDGRTTFTFVSIHGHFPMIGDIPAMRTTYAIGGTEKSVLRKTETFLEPWSLMGGLLKIKILDTATDFIQVEPGLPPFPSKAWAHYDYSSFGFDSGETEVEVVFSGYRRVKCYDDRFEVRSGMPEMKDFIIPGM